MLIAIQMSSTIIDGGRTASIKRCSCLRQSREAAAETRRKIIKVAARQFRRHGIGGISVADVMAKAGLTHGGFYKHFASKDALAAEACEWALAASKEELASIATAAPPGQGLRTIVEAYLSMAHRDHPDRGCVVAALAAEAARLDQSISNVVAEGYEALASLIASHLKAHPQEDPAQRARAIVASMVGALMISRTIGDRQLAETVLLAACQRILEQH
jgi:TetR/AcrR family transcriptional repressor of nem operon